MEFIVVAHLKSFGVHRTKVEAETREAAAEAYRASTGSRWTIMALNVSTEEEDRAYLAASPVSRFDDETKED